MEVSKLLSQAVLDTSGPASRSSTPKRPGSLALATPLPLRPENSAKPVDTSSQVSIPDDAAMDDPTQEEIHASPSPPVETPGTQPCKAPSLDVNPTPRGGQQGPGTLIGNQFFYSTLIRGKEVSDFGMALCQNESEITEAIKEAKALCAHTIRDVEVHQAVLISEAKVWHATCIKEAEAKCAHTLAEAENHCSTAIREAES